VESTIADVFRYCVLVLDAFALGTLLAIWDRVGRFVIPKTASRLFFASSIMFLLTFAVEIWARIGQPLRLRTPFAAVTIVLYIAGLISLYRWFGTEPGRRRRHDMINEFAANELHQMARIARAMEEDPEHMGRYVEPSAIIKAFDKLFRHPR